MNPVKPGVKSSEFYVTLVNGVVGLLIMTGVVTTDQGDTLGQAIVAVIGGLMIIIPTSIYIWSRLVLKKEVVPPAVTTPVAADGGSGQIPI